MQMQRTCKYDNYNVIKFYFSTKGWVGLEPQVRKIIILIALIEIQTQVVGSCDTSMLTPTPTVHLAIEDDDTVSSAGSVGAWWESAGSRSAVHNAITR